MASLSTEKWLQLGRLKDLPPYSTVYWHYKQWREAGAIDERLAWTSAGTSQKKPSGQR